MWSIASGKNCKKEKCVVEYEQWLIKVVYFIVCTILSVVFMSDDSSVLSFLVREC